MKKLSTTKSVFFPVSYSLPDAILDRNANHNPQVYFVLLGANTDKTDDICLLQNHTFSFEDVLYCSDKCYKNVIYYVMLSTNTA